MLTTRGYITTSNVVYLHLSSITLIYHLWILVFSSASKAMCSLNLCKLWAILLSYFTTRGYMKASYLVCFPVMLMYHFRILVFSSASKDSFSTWATCMHCCSYCWPQNLIPKPKLRLFSLVLSCDIFRILVFASVSKASLSSCADYSRVCSYCWPLEEVISTPGP